MTEVALSEAKDGLLLTALLISPLLARIRSEEALLQATFGDEYAACRRCTARLILGVF